MDTLEIQFRQARELGALIGHKDWADAVERYTDRYSEGGRYL